MLKRALRFIYNTEKPNTIKGIDYEKWSKAELIERLKEYESQDDNQKSISSPATPDETQSIASSGSSKSKKSKKKKIVKEFDFSKYNKRFIALKFAYLGWNYNGLNFQYEPTPLPTVEELILQALEKAKLIKKADPASCNFSRCGRTDKGVSAMNQVISLDVRSRLTKEEQLLKENDLKEIPYISVLNSMLPPDIRVTAVCLRPPEKFDARFSCSYRHYRYIFRKYDLDLDLMAEAAKKYEGGHDFRNFCKIDGSKQITNYSRIVLSSKILHLKDDFYVFDLKGTAFLWHQVRCMVAILFLVGQKLESPTIVDDLLNIEKFASKPAYEMANDVPLVLYDCVYPQMEWLTPTRDLMHNSAKILYDYSYVKELVLDLQLKARMSEIFEKQVIVDTDKLTSLPGAGNINVGDGRGRNFRNYLPIAKRELAETFESVNERYRAKKKLKLESKD